MKKVFTFIFLLCTLVSFSQSTTVVISQVYGGGGGSTGTYLFDYVELHNISGSTQLLTGFSLQYGSATGNFGSSAGNIYAFPAGTSMPAGSYLLIQLGPTGSVGAALPVTADLVTTNLTMSGASGKVVLANQATTLACGATATLCTLPGSAIIDLVAYGIATNAEGGVSANNGVALTATQGSVRKTNGCQDTDNNNSDFDVVTAPVPRNSASSIVSCGPAGPSLAVTSLSGFGNVFIGSNSTSQSYNLSGANLTGATGNITITAPSTDFEVSNNNSTWGASTTIAYTSATLAATAVWVRFSPQSAGLKTGNVTNLGGGVTAAVNVAVSGTGVVVPTAPVLSASSLTAFGNICLNTTAGPNSFTITGANLSTADITVGPLAGFSFSTTSTGSYTPSLTLSQAGGVYSQQVFVKFTPVAIQSYAGNIVVAGAAAPSINVAASASGNNNTPTMTTGAASTVTTTSATLAGTINANGCTAVSSYGIEYSLVNGFVTGTIAPSTNLNAGGFTVNLIALTPSTIYYYKAYAINAGGTGYGTQQSFTTASPILTATPLTAFTASCLNIVSGPNSFTIASTGLSNANVNVGPLAGFSFSTTASGTYSSSLSLTQPGGAYSQSIFVKFTPAAVQSYNGNIPVNGGGANIIYVTASGSGVNAPATVTTGAANGLTANAVTLAGSVNSIGCSTITSFGIEYSSIAGFANGNGIKIPATGFVSGSNFTSSISGLVQGTTYFYKAYAVNNGGIAYGAEQSFSTLIIPEGLTIYSSPIQRGGDLHYSLKVIQPGHYITRIYNSFGQMVYKRDMILQVNFIDDHFTIPSNIGTGVYSLEIVRIGFTTRKTFMIR
jgi:hypothetical protein